MDPLTEDPRISKRGPGAAADVAGRAAPRRVLSRVTTALGGIAFAVAMTAAIFGALDVVNVAIGRSPDLAAVFSSALMSLWIASVGSVGLLLAIRRPGHGIGWLFCALGLLVGYISLVWSARLPVASAVEPGYVWSSVVASFYAIALAGPVLALLFPDGRLPSGRWRRPVAVVFVLYLASVPLVGLTPGYLNELAPREAAALPADRRALEAFGLPPLAPFGELMDVVMFGTLILLGAMGVVALIVRARHGSALVRAQLRWFLAAQVLIVVGIVLAFTQTAIDPTSDAAAGVTILFLGFAMTPVTVAIAVLRYRLYDIDVVIRRTLIYTTLTAFLASFYVGAVVLLQVLVRPVTGGDTLPIAISTLAAAALVQPARRRIQAAVDRRFYRSRYDASRTVSAFTRRLRDDVELDRLTVDLVAVVDQAMPSSSVSLWVRPR